MLSLLLAVAARLEPVTVELSPTDDVWVYPHASDPMKDPFLRVWGSGGMSVYPGETGDASYSYLRFDLKTVPAGKITAAELRVISVADPVWSVALSKVAPLEVRALPFDFAEKGWKFAMAQRVAPKEEKATVFGAASVEKVEEGKPIAIAISMNETGRKAITEAGRGAISLALTTKMDPAESGQGAMYKLYSKDAEDPLKRPRLVLTVEP